MRAECVTKVTRNLSSVQDYRFASALALACPCRPLLGSSIVCPDFILPVGEPKSFSSLSESCLLSFRFRLLFVICSQSS